MRAVCMIRKEPAYRREAFESGLQRVGFKLCTDITPAGPEDWLVIWNRKMGAEAKLADIWEARGGTVIVTENGYLQKTDKTTYAISVHGHNGSGWFPVGDEDRFTKLGFEVKPWREGGHDYVVRGQRGIGLPPVASPHNWARITAAQLRQKGVLSRVYEHPGDKGKLEKDLANLKGAAGLVIWSSAMGVRALVEGVPVWYASPKWVCAEGASKLSDFPFVRPVDRNLALRKMAWGQWHHEEIASGEPFQRIIEHRSEAIW